MNGEHFLLDLPSDKGAVDFFAAVGRATALGAYFESGCKALVSLLELREKGPLESTEATTNLVMIVFARKLHKNVSFLSSRLPAKSEVIQTLDGARESRNAIAHQTTLGFSHFLDHPEALSAGMAELYEHAHRIAEGIRFIDYFLAVATHEPVPTARVLLDYPDYLANWACGS